MNTLAEPETRRGAIAVSEDAPSAGTLRLVMLALANCRGEWDADRIAWLTGLAPRTIERAIAALRCLQ